MITYCPDAFIVLNDPCMKLEVIETSTGRCLDSLPRHDKNVPNPIREICCQNSYVDRHSTDADGVRLMAQRCQYTGRAR
jgi:hypothetical protein